jgi:hypothetical protein
VRLERLLVQGIRGQRGGYNGFADGGGATPNYCCSCSGDEHARERKSRQVNERGRNGERERASVEATRFSPLGRARAWTEA